MKRYQLTVTLIEDAQFGSGTGAGDVDAFIERDAQGRPVIRASHVKGVLRETATLCRDLKLCQQQDINDLFGQSGHQRGALIMQSLYTKKSDDCPIWISTARQPGSRVPMEDTLRVIEHCPAGTQFKGELQLADDACSSLLERLIHRTDRLGGQRNRGNGLVRCEIQLLSDEPKRLKNPPTQSGAHPRLRLLLQSIEPLLLPNSGNPGNLLTTEGFIRGQVLHGALVQPALAAQQWPSVEQWLGGAVAVGDALPLPKPITDDAALKIAEVMPIPLSLGAPKPAGQSTPRPWWSQTGRGNDFVTEDNSADSLTATEKPQEKPKRPGARQFLYRPDGKVAWQRYTPNIAVRMRVNLENTEPGLFSHEEIVEKTEFVSDLVFDNPEVAETFVAGFDQRTWLRVGREGRPVRVARAVWLDTPTTAKNPGDTWRLTLTSDTLLRDEMLAFITRPDIACLLYAVGKTSGDYPDAINWQIDTRYCETTPVHGFNTVSGLRRAPALALRRGSDFIIRGQGAGQLAVDLAALGAIGERTAEGYGRFMIGFTPFHGAIPSAVNELSCPDKPEEILLAHVHELVNSLQVTLLPSRSQLGWLRSRAEAGEKPQEILARVEAAVGKMGGKAWKSFPVKQIKDTFLQPFFVNSEAQQRQYLIYLVRWLTPRIPSSIEQE